jgi:hypothetical protein
VSSPFEGVLRKLGYGAVGHAKCLEILKHVSTEAIETAILEIRNAFLALNEVRLLAFTNASP